MNNFFIKSAMFFCITLSGLVSAEPADLWIDSYTPAPVMEIKSAVTDKNITLHYSKETPVIALQPLSQSKETLEARSHRAQSANMLGSPLKVGVKRSILATETVAQLDSYLDWETFEDGSHLAALSVVSPEAVGHRFILNVEQLHPRAQLRFSSHVSDEVFVVLGEDVINSVFANKQEDASSDNNLYVGPYLEGDQATLEIFLPTEVAIESTKISIPYLSHIFISPTEYQQMNKRYSDQSCMSNAVCDPAADIFSDSVAKIVFTDRYSDTYMCTATLLNDKYSSKTPYLLTANHCVESKQEASTLQTFWFYKSDTCYFDSGSANYKKLTRGADFLFSQRTTDTVLLRLREPAPLGTTYAGWTTAPAVSSVAKVIHHPDGRPQKIASGFVDSSYAYCMDVGLDNFTCIDSSSYNAGYLQVSYPNSATAAGSSGAGLFIARNDYTGPTGQWYIAGQLFGGDTSCRFKNGTDYYGRFDLAFKAGLAQWLASDKPDAYLNDKSGVFRFYNTNTATHFFTSSEAERDSVINKYASFIYEGEAFYAYQKSAARLSPVYRFYHQVLGSHFYTISQAEKENVERTYPDYIYEGVAWYAAPVAVADSKPLYRFYNTKTGTHFYTVSAQEKDNIINKYASYIYEGVAYHVWVNKQ
ncbi:MAG TPA: hypothetical protein VJY83_03160 [Thiopseudomonas sp.]|nr:hypothetical protein [Thiopseudomonas sp.]